MFGIVGADPHSRQSANELRAIVQRVDALRRLSPFQSAAGVAGGTPTSNDALYTCMFTAAVVFTRFCTCQMMRRTGTVEEPGATKCTNIAGLQSDVATCQPYHRPEQLPRDASNPGEALVRRKALLKPLRKVCILGSLFFVR
uniref:Uncharacterized protein n=1 Tax=Panagrellus redivivus TaxID=6233 RepID=A0A7E4VD56_PANRE